MSTGSQRAPRLAPALRRAQLLDAALDVLDEDGFAAVSIEAIARRAGVTRPVIYDLFGDLSGLILALIDREERKALAPLLEIVGGDPGDADPDVFVLDALRVFLEAVRSSPRTWRLVLMPPRGSSPQLRERIKRSRVVLARRLTRVVEWAVARRGGPDDVDHELLARLIVAMGEDAARLMLAHPRRFPAERLVRSVPGLLALLPPGGGRRSTEPPRLRLPAGGASGQRTPETGTKRVPRSQRREQLLDVTLALISDHGFETLSVEAIARRAGVNRVVIYRSFPNLQLLLMALMRREEQRTRVALDRVLPSELGAQAPPALLGQTLVRFLEAVTHQPQTWRVALLRPESAPLPLQKLVNRRRSELARSLQPLVESGLRGLGTQANAFDVELLARLLLTIGEELGRLALDDPDFPPQRLVNSSWELLGAIGAA